MMSQQPLLLLGALLAALAPGSAEDPSPEGKDEGYHPYRFVLSTDQAIQRYQADLKRNPRDYAKHTLLAQMYVRKARESGDFASYERAEAAARRALELKPDYVEAQATRAAVCIAQHRFAEGLRLARELYRKDPGQKQLLLLQGDALLETGDYEEAAKAYALAESKDPRLRSPSRLARLAELQGQDRQALELMQEAARDEAPLSITREGRAWYDFRLGEMCWNAGQLDKAGRHLEEALELNPVYPLALAYLGKVRAAQGKLDLAESLYVKAVRGGGELSMLADLGDLYTQMGRALPARLIGDTVEKMARGQDVYARELALYYADHDRNLPEAVELARKDLAVRRDVYAHDALAWALCKNRRYQEAAAAMALALKPGFKDASLFYHAGMIHRGLGDKDKARNYLRRALARNPHFSFLQADQARKALKELGGD